MKPFTTIAFQTLGCKLNFSETDAISRKMAEEGFQLVGFGEIADIYVINSCSVTQNAEKRCKALIRKAMKTNPSAQVAVVGCFAQLSPGELLQIPGVSMVLGSNDKFNLSSRLKSIADSKKEDPALTNFIPSYSAQGRTRSFFKIQDGCDYHCAYCTIPLARGKSRSNTIAATLQTAREISKTDIREVVLTGVNIGDFGKPYGENFSDLLQELVNLDGFERIRLSSVEPDLLTSDIIQLVASHPKLMPHFHIPLQSGCDQVLKMMGRRYDTKLFADRVSAIRDLIPHACIAADLIVGFPTETREQFEQTLGFIEKTNISYVHVFTYSERRNTRAGKFSSQLPVAERKKRSSQLHILSARKKTAFLKANRGLTTKVLWEKEESQGMMYGFTENYIRVKTPFDAALTGQITTVQLNTLDKDGVYIK